MIVPNSSACKEGKKEGNCDYGEPIPSLQHAAVCTMCKRRWAGIGHKKFENGVSILGYAEHQHNPTL